MSSVLPRPRPRAVRSFSCAALLASAVLAQSVVVYVSPTGTNTDPGGTSVASPVRSISFALSLNAVAAANEVELRLLPGTYTTPDETFPLPFSGGGNRSYVVTAQWTESSPGGAVAMGWAGAAKILNPATVFGALTAQVGPGVFAARFEGVEFQSPAAGVRIDPAFSESVSADFERCTFRGTSGVRATPTADFASVTLGVRRCVFAGPATNNTTAIRCDGSPGGSVALTVSRCRIADYSRGLDLRAISGAVFATTVETTSFARCLNAGVRLMGNDNFAVTAPFVHCVFDSCGSGLDGGAIDEQPTLDDKMGQHWIYVVGCAFRNNADETPDLGPGYLVNGCCADSADSVMDWQDLSPLVSNLEGDPSFVDPTVGDFRLRPGSPCIGAGPVGSLADYDLDGDPFPFASPTDCGVDQFYAPHLAFRSTVAVPGSPIEAVMTGPGGVAYLVVGAAPASPIWAGGYQLGSPWFVIPVPGWPTATGTQQQVVNLGAIAPGGPLATLAMQAAFVPTGSSGAVWSLSVPTLTVTP